MSLANENPELLPPRVGEAIESQGDGKRIAENLLKNENKSVDTQERSPKFEIPEVNKPHQIVLGELFWTKPDGKSFGYRIKHEGIEKVWFVNKAVYNKLEGLSVGQPLTVWTAQKDADSWAYVEVAVSLFDDKGSEPQKPDTDSKRDAMTKLYGECLQDALNTALIYQERTTRILSETDIKDIATSFFIHRDRKGW